MGTGYSLSLTGDSDLAETIASSRGYIGNTFFSIACHVPDDKTQLRGVCVHPLAD
jgi:hypothetical protein